MPVYFKDGTDIEGRITDDFSIEYEGSQDVEAFLDQLLSEPASREDVVEAIIIEMIDDLDIREVRRTE